MERWLSDLHARADFHYILGSVHWHIPEYLDTFWPAHEMYMENHQTGKSIMLKQDNYQFQTGLTDRDFDKNSLKRAR